MQMLSRIPLLLAALGCLACRGEPDPREPPSAADRPGVTRSTAVDTSSVERETIPPCDEACPAAASGVFALVERNGNPLPDTLRLPDPDKPGRTCTFIVESDTLTLWENGTYQARTTGLTWCNDMPRPGNARPDSLDGTFTLHGTRADSISLWSDALDPAVRDEGWFVGDELRLVATRETPRITFRYVRVRKSSSWARTAAAD